MDAYGLGRVVGEPGVLPQRARRLDPSLPIRPGEVLIDVEALNVDAASFRQLEKEAGGDARRVGEAVARIVAERGKLQNPVTGSGGMLIGRVREVSPEHPAATPAPAAARAPATASAPAATPVPAAVGASGGLARLGCLVPGQRIATLVSLTLTPLHLDAVTAVHLDTDRVEVKGHAILFASGIYAVLPPDFPDALALAVLDVCGAPAQVARWVKPGMRVLVIGAGKSGALCLAEARHRLQGKGQLLALDVSRSALEALLAIGLCDTALTIDAQQGVRVLEAVNDATGGARCDLVINCASVPETEMATVLAVRDGGAALFFSMATSFTAATLGAEGVGKDVTLLMGNGYVPGHAELALERLRAEPRLRALFEARYVRRP